MDDKNVVRVEIFGTGYTIRGEENEAYIRQVAAYVDAKMREINHKLPVASLAKVAVLASLNLADELFREREQRRQHEDAVDRRAGELTQSLEKLIEEPTRTA